MLTSGRTCTPTPSCPVAPPCTPVLPTECRSRSSLPLRGSTPSGSEDPSWPPSPPSSRCGSPSRSTTSAAPPLSTASASKCSILYFQLFSISNLQNCLLHNKSKSNLQFEKKKKKKFAIQKKKKKKKKKK